MREDGHESVAPDAGSGQNAPGRHFLSKGKRLMENGGGTADVEASSVFVTAPDGLKLHVRCYGSRLAPSLPVVCLPGLTRTTADFDALATALASSPDMPRHVLAIDYRGRGLSGYDRNPGNYSLATELADLRAVLAALDVAPAVFVGTSRGGILTMLLASAQPTAIAGRRVRMAAIVASDSRSEFWPRSTIRGTRPSPSNWAHIGASGRLKSMPSMVLARRAS